MNMIAQKRIRVNIGLDYLALNLDVDDGAERLAGGLERFGVGTHGEHNLLLFDQRADLARRTALITAKPALLQQVAGEFDLDTFALPAIAAIGYETPDLYLGAAYLSVRSRHNRLRCRPGGSRGRTSIRRFYRDRPRQPRPGRARPPSLRRSGDYPKRHLARDHPLLLPRHDP